MFILKYCIDSLSVLGGGVPETEDAGDGDCLPCVPPGRYLARVKNTFQEVWARGRMHDIN